MARADRPAPTARYLRRRYLMDGMSATAIAAETGWSSQYVRDRLRDHGIPLRDPGANKSRPLSRDQLQGWIEAGQSVTEIAARSGYSVSGVRKRATQLGIAIPERIRSPLAGQRLLDELAAEYRSGESLAALGARYGHGNDWVQARLVDAGVAIRPIGRAPRISPHSVRAALDEGLRTEQIADRLGCSPTTVQDILRQRGWSPPPARPRGPSRNLPPVPSRDQLQALYVDEKLTVGQIAQQAGISAGRVTRALAEYGIPSRRPGWTNGAPPPPITAEQLNDLYVRQDLRIDQTAAALSTTSTRVRAALRRCQIPIRPERRPLPPAPLTADELTDLYVRQRLDDKAIGARLQMSAWRVRQRRDELGVRRPASTPPHPPAVAAPPAKELEVLYLGQGLTLKQIARRFHTAAPKVREWLVEAGIPVKPRTTRATRKQPDPAQVRELYVDREWSSNEIAAHLDVSQQQVLRVLHEHGVPVRRGPSRRHPHPDSARLTALYEDPDVRALLRRHGIPHRRVTGGIAERFPRPYPLTYEMLTEGYLVIGLSAAHLEQITGNSQETVYNSLHANGIVLRPAGSFSPWFLRQRRMDALS